MVNGQNRKQIFNQWEKQQLNLQSFKKPITPLNTQTQSPILFLVWTSTGALRILFEVVTSVLFFCFLNYSCQKKTKKKPSFCGETISKQQMIMVEMFGLNNTTLKNNNLDSFCFSFVFSPPALWGTVSIQLQSCRTVSESETGESFVLGIFCCDRG